MIHFIGSARKEGTVSGKVSSLRSQCYVEGDVTGDFNCYGLFNLASTEKPPRGQDSKTTPLTTKMAPKTCPPSSRSPSAT
jgi:hypothetical protein